MRWQLAILLLAACVTACAAPPQHNHTSADVVAPEIRREILEELDRYYADFSARRWHAFTTHFWPGATITTIWQPPGESAERVVVTTIDKFVELAPQGPGSKTIFQERMTNAQVRMEGNLAQVWAKYDAKFGDPGAVAQWSGTDAFTLMKHDGRWRIVALVFVGE